MHRKILVLLVVCSFCLAGCSSDRGPTYAATRPATQPHNFNRWDKAIAAYETKDLNNPPPKGGIEFIGSSTIAGWKTLAADYPGQPVFNRGFGGSQICDATHYADRIIFPYEPKMIFLRSGGNDLHLGKSVEQVFEDYKEFVSTVYKRLPKTTIVYIAISPAPSRWAERHANKMLNEKIKSYTRGRSYLKYCETYDMVLTPQGEARGELFVSDRLHFNAEGYKLLAERVRPYLPK